MSTSGLRSRTDPGRLRPAIGLALALQAALGCGPTEPSGARDAGQGGQPDCAAGSPSPEPANSRPRGLGYSDDPEPLPAHVAYLSFDDGPSEWTPDVLDVLQQQAILATFFITARQLKAPAGLNTRFIDARGSERTLKDVLATIVAQGHAIGNHTVDHLDLETLDLTSAACQFDQNERLINTALSEQGVPPRALTLLRPPFGSPWHPQSPLPDPTAEQARIGSLLATRGVNVLWSIDSTDSREWARGETFSSTAAPSPPAPEAPSYDDKVARILASVLQDPRVASGAGAIILLHDTHNATRDALPALIAGLRAADYTFATLEDLVVSRWQASSSELYPRPALREQDTPDCTRAPPPTARPSSPHCDR
jgi:peptidoglycan/xylan/chitin deacetylase (PgdA/CDA1 family)